jgi:nucleoside-diphosphate-sugar epimerase
MRTVSGRRVAVVGGTGFIGSHLTERLVAEGAEVLAVARSEARVSSLAAVRHECTIALADICDADGTIRMMRRFRPAIVFFLASHPDAGESFGHIAEGMRVNGLGLINALQAAAAAESELFVYGASAKDYGNTQVPYRASQTVAPVCSYAILKSAGWQLCQLVSAFAGLKTVALRPTFVYGPRQGRNVITHVHECVSAGRPVRLMGGDQTRDPLYIDDAVDAFVAAACAPAAWGHAIPIGGGQELTVRALCETALAALGASVPVMSGAEPPRMTEIWRSSSDNADAYRLLGWQPRVSLAEGLARTIGGWSGRAITSTATATAIPRRAGAGAYLLTTAPGVVYRMLDRRQGVERRSVFRGGRRAEDARVLAGVTAGNGRTAAAEPHANDTYSPLVGDSM